MSERAPKKTTRREVLSTAFAAAATAGFVRYGSELSRTAQENSERSDTPRVEPEPGFNDFSPREFEIPEALRRKPITGLASAYFGIPAGSRFPETLGISYSENLRRLWQLKEKKARGNPETEDESRESSRLLRAVQEVGSHRVDEYAARWNWTHHPDLASEPRSLDDALGRAETYEVVNAVDDRLEGIKRVLPDIRRELVQQYGTQLATHFDTFLDLANRIDARMLMAYSITELFGQDGEFGAELNDFLLRTAGKEFIAKIPSLGDRIPSFGDLQFTKIGFATGKGAERINSFLPPGVRLESKTLDDLETYEDQLLAGYLYALNVISYALSQLNEPHQKQFGALDDRTLLGFVATSHNNPTLALDALKRWFNASSQHPVMHGEHAFRASRQIAGDFTDYCSSAIQPYGRKTSHNYDGLEAVLAEKIPREVSALDAFLRREKDR